MKDVKIKKNLAFFFAILFFIVAIWLGVLGYMALAFTRVSQYFGRTFYVPIAISIFMMILSVLLIVSSIMCIIIGFRKKT